MKNWIKIALLYILISITSFLSIVIVGIIGLPNNVLLKIIIWIIAGLVSYFLWIFVPFFDRKRKKYLDGFALASAYLIILIISLSRSTDINDFEYVSTFSFAAGIPFISEIFSKIKISKKEKNVNLSIENQIIELFSDYDCFSLIDVTSSLRVSEHKGRKVLKSMIEANQIKTEKRNKRLYYKVMK